MFYQEHCQTLFLINLAEKSEDKQTSKFLPKSWTKPLEKSANFQLPKINYFVR